MSLFSITLSIILFILLVVLGLFWGNPVPLSIVFFFWEFEILASNLILYIFLLGFSLSLMFYIHILHIKNALQLSKLHKKQIRQNRKAQQKAKQIAKKEE